MCEDISNEHASKGSGSELGDCLACEIALVVTQCQPQVVFGTSRCIEEKRDVLSDGSEGGQDEELVREGQSQNLQVDSNVDGCCSHESPLFDVFIEVLGKSCCEQEKSNLAHASSEDPGVGSSTELCFGCGSEHAS